MRIVSFSRMPRLVTLLISPPTQLGLFGSALSESVSKPVKAVKKGRSRKLAAVVGPHICHLGKKDLLSDERLNASPKRSLGSLKIVRQFEPGASPLCAGRMTISGSMADVCAELDRLAHLGAVTYCN